MPRDDWAKYRRRDIGRKAAREAAAEQLSNSRPSSRWKKRSCRTTTRLVEYTIPAGTISLVKRVGDKSWKRFRTRRELTFDSPYRDTEKSLIFFRDGFLLCVTKEKLS